MSDLTYPFRFHERLRLQNFTAFSDVTLEFVPGINVLVGENGTGKTHIMKALYAWQIARHLTDQGSNANYEQVFSDTYGVKFVGELQRTKSKTATVSGKFDDNEWSVGLQQSYSTDNGVRPLMPRPIYIPAMEMMAHARNMNGILRDYADFDRTCFDFLAMVTAQPTINGPATDSSDAIAREEMNIFKKLVPGAVEWNEEQQRFYLMESGKRLPFQLVAEGVRKVSALYRLIELNWIRPGGVLFWDEPEVNLNPKWMDEVIEVLAIVARSGVQIFLATHSYVILKEIDLVLRDHKGKQANEVSARFFALHKERGVSKVMWADDFAALEPNPILDHYDQMLAEDWRLQDREDSAE